MRTKQLIALSVGLCVVTAGLLAFTQPQTTTAIQKAEAAPIRIGTYDNRAIAIAFARSEHNPVSEKMAQYEEAKKAGNEAKVKELEAWGKNTQRKLHFQGFGHVPVGDLLEPVKDGIAEVAAKHNLTAIVMEYDFVAEGVEVIDVTNELVALYGPSEQATKWIKDLKNVKPLGLIELADMPAEH